MARGQPGGRRQIGAIRPRGAGFGQTIYGDIWWLVQQKPLQFPVREPQPGPFQEPVQPAPNKPPSSPPWLVPDTAEGVKKVFGVVMPSSPTIVKPPQPWVNPQAPPPPSPPPEPSVPDTELGDGRFWGTPAKVSDGEPKLTKILEEWKEKERFVPLPEREPAPIRQPQVETVPQPSKQPAGVSRLAPFLIPGKEKEYGVKPRPAPSPKPATAPVPVPAGPLEAPRLTRPTTVQPKVTTPAPATGPLEAPRLTRPSTVGATGPLEAPRLTRPTTVQPKVTTPAPKPSAGPGRSVGGAATLVGVLSAAVGLIQALAKSAAKTAPAVAASPAAFGSVQSFLSRYRGRPTFGGGQPAIERRQPTRTILRWRRSGGFV